MIALDGPMQGKYYHDGVTSNKLVDNIMVNFIMYEVMYYRTKNGWKFHSWKALSDFTVNKKNK